MLTVLNQVCHDKRACSPSLSIKLYFNVNTEESLQGRRTLKTVCLRHAFMNDEILGLVVKSASLNIEENTKSHHTTMFGRDELTVRRGTPFTVDIVFNKQVNLEDNVNLSTQLKNANREKILQTQEIKISVPTSDHEETWSANILPGGSTDKKTFTIYAPSNAIIGCYTLIMKVGGNTFEIGNFSLLFNPWATDDEVYMADEIDLKAYHELNVTAIFKGSEKAARAYTWDLGQWEEGMLPICFKLLDSTKQFTKDPMKDVLQRNNPIYVTRCLSSIINSNDDKGVLEGNWSGQYEKGTSPSSWNGSVAILKQWYENKSPVKYGQCWVFAGVLCTVFRCLGIPSRVITNFASAHDTHGNINIEIIYDVDGNIINREYSNSDSVWNYHCWTEAWLSRNLDLGKEYSGWQILDATPQEKSDGLYCLGPASQTAVKEGLVEEPYDTQFVYSEVNADRAYFQKDEQGNLRRLTPDTKSIGKLTCTTGTDGKTFQDITLQYKYEEGTTKEREVHGRAREKATTSDSFLAMSADFASSTPYSGKTSVSCEITESGDSQVGQDVHASVTLTNVTDNSKDVKVIFNVNSTDYTRRLSSKIWTTSQEIMLGSKAEQSIPVKVAYQQYKKALTSDNILNITVLCEVKNESTVLAENNVILENPPLDIKVVEQAIVGKMFPVEVSFLNPLDEPVKDCVVTVEGSGLAKKPVVKNVPTIEPAQTAMIQFELTPHKSGKHELSVNLTCDRFKDVKGIQTIDVFVAP